MWQIIVSFFAGGGIFAVVVIWVIYHPELLEKWAAIFFKTFGWVSEKFEYSNVAMNVQSNVNTYGQKISKEAPDVLPYAMKIEWIKNSQSVEATLRKGEIVVTLDKSSNRERNLVVSTLSYLNKGLLPRARPYVDSTLIKATDFTVAKEVFVNSGQTLATDYFFDKYLKPEINSNKLLEEDCRSLDCLNEKGYFSRMYLKQLKILGDKVYPRVPDQSTAKETRDFMNFLLKIAQKEKGTDVPGGLTFTGTKIRVNILLVAKQRTLDRAGILPYKRRIELCRNMGIEYVYVCGISNANIALAEYLVREQQESNALIILDSQKFRFTSENNNDYNAICILCSLRSTLLSTPLEEIRVIMNMLEEYVPEITGGEVEVVYLARSIGVKTKVIVRSVSQNVDALKIFSDPVKVTAMQFSLGGEIIEFVNWSDKTDELIISSLTLKPEQVVEALIDEGKKQALIQVVSQQAKAIASGYGNINIKLAMELTGFNISVEVKNMTQ